MFSPIILVLQRGSLGWSLQSRWMPHSSLVSHSPPGPQFLIHDLELLIFPGSLPISVGSRDPSLAQSRRAILLSDSAHPQTQSFSDLLQLSATMYLPALVRGYSHLLLSVVAASKFFCLTLPSLTGVSSRHLLLSDLLKAMSEEGVNALLTL